MTLTDTRGQKLARREPDSELTAGPTARAPLAPCCAKADGYADKTETMSKEAFLARSLGVDEETVVRDLAQNQYVDKTEKVARTVVVERKPRKRLPPRAPTQPTEEQIHRTVVEHLERFAAPGVFYFHVPNGDIRHKGAAGRLKAMGTRAGVPDLVLIKGGHTYGLELKRPGEKQSDNQILVEGQWEHAGGTYAVAHGLDYALDTLREWGLLE